MTEGDCPKCGEPGLAIEIYCEDVVMDSTGKKMVHYIEVTEWICPNCSPIHYTRRKVDFHGRSVFINEEEDEWECPKCGEPGLDIDEYDEDVVMDSTGKNIDRCVKVTEWICPDCAPIYYTRREVDFRKSRACDDESEGEE